MSRPGGCRRSRRSQREQTSGRHHGSIERTTNHLAGFLCKVIYSVLISILHVFWCRGVAELACSVQFPADQSFSDPDARPWSQLHASVCASNYCRPNLK